MLQIVQNNRTGKITVEDTPAPGPMPGQILVENLHSVVSAGTEKSSMDFARSSLLGKARSRPDLAQKVFRQFREQGLKNTYRMVKDRLDAPQSLGYSCSGRVISVGEGVTDIQPGMTVACAGAGYASHAEFVSVPKNLVVEVPSKVDTRSACFATLGAIAIQGVRRTELTLGECVLVIGLGLLGQLTVQILKAYGFPVMGVDVDSSRVEESIKQGMDVGATIGVDDISATAQQFSSGFGLDAAIITASTPDNSPTELAGELLRERGRVSAVGAFGMDIPRRVYYPKELDFRISRSYGPGRYDASYEEHGLDYPQPWVRWTEQRNMQEFLRLLEQGSVDVERLITHVYPIEDATIAYSLVGDNPDQESFLGVVIEYPTQTKQSKRTVITENSAPVNQRSSKVRVGLIGAGNFMTGTLVPALSKINDISISAVASERGLTAKHLAEKLSARIATSDYSALIESADVDVLVAATRHNGNAEIAMAALDAGKSVHIEKPLAITIHELRKISKSADASSGNLNVGFNRRCAPLVDRLNDHFSDRSTPLMMSYRINAGRIEPDHWLHDPVIGGGRILGEVCHFVDLLQHLAGAKPIRVIASALAADGENVMADDNVIATLDFADGSRGSIVYSALGATSQPKEQLEVMSSGKSAVLDDFTALETWTGSNHKKHKSKPDKGHANLLGAFVDSVRSGTPAPIAIDQLTASTLATLAIEKSIAAGLPVTLDNDTLELFVTDPTVTD